MPPRISPSNKKAARDGEDFKSKLPIGLASGSGKHLALEAETVEILEKPLSLTAADGEISLAMPHPLDIFFRL